MHSLPPVPELLQRLATFATAVQSILARPGIDWHWRPRPSEWSLNMVMCHLRDVELEVHQPRFRSLIAKDNPFLQGILADDWVETRQYAQQDGPQARDDFLNARAVTVTMLSELTPDVWQRQARHAFLGPTTLQELVDLAIKHDDAHWSQIETLTKVR